VLDVGCGDGKVTLIIAVKYFPEIILGIDLDYFLIKKAQKTFHNFEIHRKLFNNRKP
jgi:trans-aconitate methyltransferase